MLWDAVFDSKTHLVALVNMGEDHARLIAAAPKMLTTLKSVRDFLEIEACSDCGCEGANPACGMLDEVEQAIEEAEGKS